MKITVNKDFRENTAQNHGKQQAFDDKLKHFITLTLPEIYKLLKINKVKDAENMILNEINAYIVSASHKQEWAK